MHFGVILPNYGKGSSPDGIRRVAEAAEELEFDSVWATEHIIVGPEAVDPYGRVYDPLVTLGWIAGWTQRIGLGTSIVLVPLHNPIHLAKEVATLQELSGGRFTLGVGMGWHKDEFEFMGVEFKGRGRRADEAIRLMRALWNGERDFDGAMLVVPQRDLRTAPVATARDLGRRQLRPRRPASARTGRRLASLTRLRRQPRTSRQRATPRATRDPAHVAGAGRGDARGRRRGRSRLIP